ELTGELSADYPLSPGETPPKESELSLVHAELALQMKIYEAARKLCREEHLNKAVKRSRVQQCKREEKRLKELQEAAFRLKLQHGRSSPLPAFMVPLPVALPPARSYHPWKPAWEHWPATAALASSSCSDSKLSESLANSAPSTPELHLHRKLSLRISNPETPLEAEKSRGRTRGVRRRLTDYTVTIPETPMVNPAGNYVNQANSEDSNSEHSSTSRTSSVCHEQHRHYQHLSPTGRVGPPPAFQQGPGFYQNSRYQSGASFNRGYYGADVAYALDLDRGYPPHRRDYVYAEVAHLGLR
ncbi:hypothetical protein CRUP_022023, partial [Coryphaenoides rupestris]